MKFNVAPTLLGGLLLVAGGVWATREPAKEAVNRAVGGDKEERFRSSRSVDTAESSWAFVSGFQQLDYNGAPRFADLEKRMGALSDDQLFELLEGVDPKANFAHWMRAAIWAELGRRNNPKAFEMLMGLSQSSHWANAGSVFSQTAFAFFRGRAESLDSFEAIRDQLMPQVEALRRQGSHHPWRQRVMERVFQRMAEVDPGQSWEMVDASSWSEEKTIFVFNDEAAISYSRFLGFFRGLQNGEEVRRFLEQWQPVVESPAYRKVYQNYRTPVLTSIRRFCDTKMPPLNEYLISHALAAQAKFDPGVAEQWLEDHRLRPDQPDHERLVKMWQAFGREFPGEAMEHLSNPDLSGFHFEIAAEIGMGNLMLASDLMSVLEGKPEVQGKVLNQLIDRGMGSANVDGVNHGGVEIDQYPVPDRYNRIPNFQERHDQLMEAIELSEVSPEAKDVYRKELTKKSERFLNQSQ